jgi:uncharacterized Zn finger protein
MRANWWDFEPSRPRPVKGGIRPQSRRGAFGESWWAKRWLAVLDGFHIGARLNRGRSYARRGQVLSVEIEKGLVAAKVQGSRARPYQVTIKMKMIPQAGWEKLTRALRAQARFAAELLSGRMPEDIEEMFAQAGLSLFPERQRDLQTKCSCPDWSNPCKHIAAVYFLLGAEFDRDPFLIFRLRGMTRDELLAQFRDESAAARPAPPEAEAPGPPLAADPDLFWRRDRPPDDLFGPVALPPEHAALPKRLGPFPMWRGQERFLDAMEEIYRHAAPLGLEAFLGEGKERGA